MRKLVVWNLMTLDGYFEGANPWDIDFHMLAWGDELERLATELGNEGDLLIFGRRTYEGMASYWPTDTETPEIGAYMNSIAKIAASRTLDKADWNNTRVVSNIAAEVKKLKNEPGKTIFVFGSAEVADVLLKAGLVDEIRLCLVPVILGGGNPHFKPATEQVPLKLLESKALKTGGLILRYEPVKAA
ncbi:dihydrofolate reductase family protein [Rhizobium sp. P44RR-XXIV]|uniref:dihydrofolate reductase family protein n=1 Tax=Rhizobium sp. P44RR-XXIV TaxID=1921145 RepID=UPI000986D03F|nr:dihydrofolate reductase family protein [Rhizobium sp. P44RR-XXIV]TIX92058.1 dihydrofolate reductase [Rhizobium sp. P44RR-XXIV]